MNASIEEQIANAQIGEEIVIHFPYGGLQVGGEIGFEGKQFEILQALENKSFLLKRIS